MGKRYVNRIKGSRRVGILLAVLLAAVLLRAFFLFPGGRPVLRSSREADLRGQRLSLKAYERFSDRMPECHILWDIPIGGSRYDSTSREITLDSLSAEDFPCFALFENLQRIDARNCGEYILLAQLQQLLPECEILWGVPLGSCLASPEETALALEGSGVTAAELLENLRHLPKLETVSLTDAALTAGERAELRRAYPEIRFRWFVKAGGKTFFSTDTKLSFAGKRVKSQELIDSTGEFYEVQELNLTGCGFTPEELLAVQEAFGGTFIRSDLTVLGKTFGTVAEELDFSGIAMENTEAVEEILPLMPNLEKVVMCDCGISSEEMDALNRRYPDIRFIWTVRIGRAKIRTDAVSFIGAKHGYLPNAYIRNPHADADRRLFDKDCAEFRYCVDMVCMDLGHMGVTDYSFLEYMPKLKYLILADTPGTDFSVLEKLPELIYLELFMTDFDQPELLRNLTKLECLNLGFTHLTNPDVLKELTWLEMLWLPGTHMGQEKYAEIKAALPDTRVNTTAKHSTAGGWRRSQNYYDMRDLLGMYYLD